MLSFKEFVDDKEPLTNLFTTKKDLGVLKQDKITEIIWEYYRIGAAIALSQKTIEEKTDALSLLDHGGQNVFSWKIGKVLGNLIYGYAISKGVSPVVAKIASETVFQASSSTFVHAIQQKRKGKLEANDLIRHFISEVAAATMGKVTHNEAEALIEELVIIEYVKTIIPLLGGKFSGLGTNLLVTKVLKKLR